MFSRTATRNLSRVNRVVPRQMGVLATVNFNSAHSLFTKPGLFTPMTHSSVSLSPASAAPSSLVMIPRRPFAKALATPRADFDDALAAADASRTFLMEKFTAVYLARKKAGMKDSKARSRARDALEKGSHARRYLQYAGELQTLVQATVALSGTLSAATETGINVIVHFPRDKAKKWHKRLDKNLRMHFTIVSALSKFNETKSLAAILSY